MLQPEFFDNAIYDYLELMAKVDQSITEDMVRRICNTGMVTDYTKWQAEKLQQGGLLYDDVLASLAKNSDATTAEIKRLFEDAGITALEYDDAIYQAAGLSPPALRQSPALIRALNAGLKKTNGVVKNLTMTTAVSAQSSYYNACDLAYQQFLTGAFDYQTIVRRAAQSAIDDEIGRAHV